MLRRSFLQTCGISAMGLTALGAKPRILSAKAAVNPRGSAENLILVFLQGAASHVDTFDLKTGSWTPADFEPATVGNFQLPVGLFPNLSNQADKFSLLRCISGTEAVHQRASYVFETAQTFNPTFSKEQPHIGSVIAYELEAAKTSPSVLPTFFALNGLVQGSGLLPSNYAAFLINSQDGVPGLDHPGGQAVFEKRYQSLLNTDGKNRLQGASNGDNIFDYHNFYQLGQGMMYQSELEGVFGFSDEEAGRYGNSNVGAGCAIAVKTLSKDLGARVIQVNQGGWDHHYDIYSQADNNGLYSLTGSLDTALASMLEDLADLPGKRGGSLLDETLVVVTGEFGRTPGDLTRNLGRDHYPYAWSALVAGGGIEPGQAFGATDDNGALITDRFWSQNRFIAMQDLVATMYSSLGIDWTKEIEDTPSGRVYEYTPKYNGSAGYYTDVVEMFS